MNKKHPYGMHRPPFNQEKATEIPVENRDNAAPSEQDNLHDLSAFNSLHETGFPGGLGEFSTYRTQERTPEQTLAGPAAPTGGDTTMTAPAPLNDEEIAALAKLRICPQCPVAKEAESERLRALAEAENTRKRMAREKEEFTKFAASGVLSDLLPSLDNMDLALAHAQKHEACKDLYIGVDMTKKLLLEAIKKHGLEPVGKVGDEFDPALHEAVGLEDNPDVDNGKISTLITRGYKLHDRLLRPAKVMVCKK